MFRKIIKGLKDVWCGTLEFDTEPKKDSFNPVTSGGVYDAINGAGGAKEIVYFDVDPSDPPSGIHTAIGEALSKNKLPVLKIDGAVYFYTATGTDKHVFVGGYTKEAVGYTEIEVSDDDSVTSKSVDDKVFNMYMLYRTDPASPGDPPGTGDQPGAGYWICDENKHVITKTELMAAHANCRYFVLNNDIEPDSNTRKYFASVTVISNSNIRILFSMIQTDDGSAAEFTEKLVMADSEGRLYVLRSYEIYLAETNNAVLVSEPQNFDSTQKAQGRSNIGAASASDVTALQSQVSSLSDVSAYSVKGEATVAQLNAGPSGIQAGWAYQLTDSGTLTDGSLAVVAGDTVAWDGTKWFPLVTTVQDGSLTEAKFSDALKLMAIKDYVTPEMFGAVGDGVTDDTAALSEALTHKVIIFPPNKTYIVEPLDVGRSNVIIYGNGSTLKAKSVTQSYVVRFQQRNYWVEQINIRGGEDATCDGIVLDAGAATSANVNFRDVNISNCGKAFYSKSYYWDSVIEKVRIDNCNYGFYNENEILSVKLDTVYFNQCKESLYLYYGCSSLYLINCEFGSVVPGSRWIYIGNVVRTLYILGSSFEECKIDTNSAPICILSGSRIIFESCDFTVLTKVEGATDTSFLVSKTSSGTNTRIEFSHCRFNNNSGIDYCYNYVTGDQSIQIIFDFESFRSLIYSLGRTSFNALGVYSTSILRLTIKDIPLFVTSLPDVSIFGTVAAVKNLFKGTLARLTKTASVYMFDGSSWVEFSSTLPVDLTALAERVTALENLT